MADLAGGVGLAGGELLGGELGEGVGEGLEVGAELLLVAALLVLARGRGGGALCDLGDEGRVPDLLPVALGLDEGVADGGLGPVDLARGEGVGEALGGLEAEGLPLRGGCGGLGRGFGLDGWAGGCLLLLSWGEGGREGITILICMYVCVCLVWVCVGIYALCCVWGVSEVL